MQDHINDKIAENTGLIFSQLKNFYLAQDPEAESIGYEALYNAILTYDSSKGTKFSTHATVYIYNALGSYVRALNKKRQLDVMSYNAVAYAEDGMEHEFVDFIAAPSSVEDSFVQNELSEMVKHEIQQLYDELTNAKHKAIVKEWITHEYDVSMSHIAKVVGVSQPYVSQIINSFKHKLKKRMEDYYYD